MPNSSKLCVDASLVVRFVTSVPDAAIQGQWRRWRESDLGIVAPDLLRYEVANSLHRLARAGESTADEARQALETALRIPIVYHNDLDLHRAALSIAGRFNLPAAYDAHYLALAEREGIEFWTADRRGANSVGHHLSWVRFVGAEPPADGGAG